MLSASGKEKRESSSLRAESRVAHISSTYNPHWPHLATKETGKYSLTGQPHAQLKLGDSITKEWGNRYRKQLAASAIRNNRVGKEEMRKNIQ